jgi:hypothetical protein
VTIFGISLAISFVVPSTEIVARPNCDVPDVVCDTFTEVGSIVVVAVEVSGVLVERTVDVSGRVFKTVCVSELCTEIVEVSEGRVNTVEVSEICGVVAVRVSELVAPGITVPGVGATKVYAHSCPL